MPQDSDTHSKSIRSRPNDRLDYGIVDLYARRMSALAASEAIARYETVDRFVVTQPFGRAFTAQPSFAPEPETSGEPMAGGVAGLRRRFGASPTRNRKLATS